MDPKLQTLAKLVVELLAVILLFGNFCKHLQALLHKVLLDHTQDLVLLQSLPRDAQRKILRIHDALNKIQPLWDELVTIIQKTRRTYNLMLLRFFLVSNKSKGARRGTKNQRAELKLAFHAGMLH